MYGCWTQMQLHRWSQTLQKTNQHLQARSEFLDYRNQTLQNESKLLDSEKQKLQHDMAEMEKQNQTLQSHHKLIDREMAEMNQTLQKKSKFLHSERQKLQNDMAEMNKDIAEIDKWNQTLQERREFLDHKEAEIGEQIEKLRQLRGQKQMPSTSNQTLGKSYQNSDPYGQKVFKEKPLRLDAILGAGFVSFCCFAGCSFVCVWCKPDKFRSSEQQEDAHSNASRVPKPSCGPDFSQVAKSCT
ncbi:unnamed protein product [Symbiodinium necroappetens]|uniref:Uncharacterized protein n=1 Tax=Symbiodinium necroappetens TaxID=1628268 RepID=A0A813AEF2_9DINO|nr:unnamed protein product [Symbiodinium necroappetens]